MNFSTIKTLAVTSAVALTLLAGANAQAQVTSTIGADFRTAPALTTAPGNNIDFGTWAINVGGTDTLTIPLTAVTTGNPPVPTCSGVVDAASLCVNTVAPGPGGSVTVTTPVATTVQINGVITNNFVDATLTLGSLVFTDTVATNQAIPTATSPATVATTTSNAAETIGIGGTLSITGGTPAASGVYNASDVDITFQY